MPAVTSLLIYTGIYDENEGIRHGRIRKTTAWF
jgi:hypothetical protein